MIMAESRGCVSHSFVEFWFGHTGDISARYSTNKGMLPNALLDEMRNAFKRSEEFLDLEKTENNPLIVEKEKVKENIENLTSEQLAKVQKLVVHSSLLQYRQQVVTAENAEKLIIGGYEFVANLPNGKVVVRKGSVYA